MAELCMGCMEPIGDDEKICPHCGYEVGSPPMEAYHIKPGTVLAERYIIGRVIGFGGFGVTYLAYDKVLEKRIAIKEYLPGEFSGRMANQLKVTVYSGDKEEQFLKGKEKFIDEAVRLAKFQNVHEIVHVYDCFEENQTAYIVMEYLEGETLKNRLEREGRMSVEQALPVILDVLHALEAVHEADILHRDIAPDNIFITEEGQVKLLDFGAARFATTTHSRSLTVLIKQGFAPEEQYRSRGDQGPWTDVYAVAATFYKMITGIVPEDALERAARDTLKEPSKLGVKIGPNTETAIMNAMNVKIEGRTQTAKQFEEELLANVVKRVVVKKQKIDIGKWPLWVKLVSAVAGTGILLFAVLLGTGVIKFDTAAWSGISVPEGKTRVPNVVNEEMETAIERGTKANLNVQVYDKQYSAEIPENRVLSQTVKGGAVVDINESLGIVISAGIEKTKVPNVIGVNSEVAVQLLKDAGLVVKSSEKEYRAAPGTIGWQSLEAETEVDTGTDIEIIISQGIKGGDSSKTEVVEELVGQEYDVMADKLIEKYLYLVRAGSEYSDEVPMGSIISQEPQAGTQINQNSNISVVVSLGREMMTVPDVQFKTQEEAVELLEAAGLAADIRQEANQTVAEGNIIRQDVESGERMEKGASVTIYVSTGAPAQRPNNAGNTGGNAGGTPQQTAPAQPQQTEPAQPQQTAAPAPPQQTEPVQTQAPQTAAPADEIWDIIGD